MKSSALSPGTSRLLRDDRVPSARLKGSRSAGALAVLASFIRKVATAFWILAIGSSALESPDQPGLTRFLGCGMGMLTFKDDGEKSEPLEMWEALRDGPPA